jgi:hypothetical protein
MNKQVCDACRDNGRTDCTIEEEFSGFICEACGYGSCRSTGFTPMVREFEGHMPDDADFCDDCRPDAYLSGWYPADDPWVITSDGRGYRKDPS